MWRARGLTPLSDNLGTHRSFLGTPSALRSFPKMQRFAANIGWLALIGLLLVLFGTFQAESALTSASAHAFYASCNDLQAGGDQTSVTLAPGVAEFQAPIVCETPMVSTHVWAGSLSVLSST